MEQQPVDVLGGAIDRLIAHCQNLDRDRTELAQAVGQLQNELVQARNREQELVARVRKSEEKQQRAADRLDRLIESLGGARTASVEVAATTMPSVLKDFASGASVAKTFDIERLERIVRDTAAGAAPRDNAPRETTAVEEAVPVPVVPFRAEGAAGRPEGGRDRLF